jgi:hypothetical protein
MSFSRDRRYRVQHRKGAYEARRRDTSPLPSREPVSRRGWHARYLLRHCKFRYALVCCQCCLLTSPVPAQRDKTRLIADHHASLAKTVDMSIVQHLQKLRAEIKAHIKNIQMDTGKLAAVRMLYSLVSVSTALTHNFLDADCC